MKIKLFRSFPFSRQCFCLVLLTFWGFSVKGVTIKIIESQSYNAGHVMDTKWLAEVTAMGHTASIVPQTTLDNNGFFASTDLLIVSSGVIGLTPTRVQNIIDFVQSGKPVYIQGEYLTTYSSNIAFKSVVDSTGSSFTLGITVSGTLAPMNVLGAFATTPNAVAPLGYFWYGSTGTGTNITYFLQYGGNYFGFYHCSPNPAYGAACMTTDQDWINQSTSPLLMRNIIYQLLNSCHLLPIELLSFDAKCDASSIKVQWETAAETNNQFFSIERSADGDVFETIGVVNGAGNSNAVLNYTFLDEKPLNGTSYYRLKQTDMDGRFEYFGPVSFTNNCSSDGGSTITVFNNPVENELTFQLIAPFDEELYITIYDMCGRTVIKTNVATTAGNNNFSMDVHSISKGIYFLSIEGKSFSARQKFVHK